MLKRWTFRGYAEDHRWDGQGSDFALAGPPLSGSSHLTSSGVLIGWILYFFSHLADERGRATPRLPTYESQGLSSGDPVSSRLSTPRLSATFLHRGWHEQTDQTDRTGNSWIVAKKADTLDESKPTRPVFHAVAPFKSCSFNECNSDNIYLWDILKNKWENPVPGFRSHRFSFLVRNSIDFFRHRSNFHVHVSIN